MGDSTTEGVGDPDPDQQGRLRGWADRLAARLAAADDGVLYANIAVRGRLTRQLHLEQLDHALDLRPDLVSLLVGMNDLLRPAFDHDDVAEDIESMTEALRAHDATVLLFTLPDPARVMPIARPLGGRFRALSAAVRAIAARTGARVIDLEAHAVAGDPRLWCEDRLHANPEGHRRIADAAAHVLGLPGASDAWTEPLDAPRARSLDERLRTELDWARRSFAPWIGRRLRGRSSGDGITAKRPTLEPVLPVRG